VTLSLSSLPCWIRSCGSISILFAYINRPPLYPVLEQHIIDLFSRGFFLLHIRGVFSMLNSVSPFPTCDPNISASKSP
jgi:hypothetical protein